MEAHTLRSQQTPSRNIRTVKVPEVISMTEYIAGHFMEQIASHINHLLEEGCLEDLFGYHPGTTGVTAECCSIKPKHTNYWYVDMHTCLADLFVTFSLEDHAVCEIILEMYMFMKEDIEIEFGDFADAFNEIERNMIKLDSYLIPIFDKQAIDTNANKLLEEYDVTDMRVGARNRAFMLADRLGLKIISLPLHKNNAESVLYFQQTTVLTKSTDISQRHKEPESVEVEPLTIVINTNVVHKDMCMLPIFHECIHYPWHFMFYRLQSMNNNDIGQLKRKQVTVIRDKVAPNPIRWLERQARYGSFALMLPMDFLQREIRSGFHYLDNSNRNEGSKYDYIGRQIAENYQIPRFRVRARMIQAGHIGAMGALNFIDDHYITPFAFSHDSCNYQETFVVSRADVMQIYMKDASFREKIDSGAFIYVDGHVCVNSDDYVTRSRASVAMKLSALDHIDECCMRFKSIYVLDELGEKYFFESLNSDEEYNHHYMEYAEIEKLTGMERFKAMSSVIKDLQPSFAGALDQLMKKHGLTNGIMEARSGVSERQISRLRNEDRRSYNIDHVVAICVALNLPPWMSDEMLKRANLTLGSSPADLCYKAVLQLMFMQKIDEVQKDLIKAGCKPLKVGSYAAKE